MKVSGSLWSPPLRGLGHQKGRVVVFLAEQALQFDICTTFDMAAFDHAVKPQSDRSQWQRGVSEENDFAVLHGSRCDGDLEGSGGRMMQRHIPGQRGAGLGQQDVGTTVPTRPLFRPGVQGRCVGPGNVRLRRAAAEKTSYQDIRPAAREGMGRFMGV